MVILLGKSLRAEGLRSVLCLGWLWGYRSQGWGALMLIASNGLYKAYCCEGEVYLNKKL